MYCNDDEFESLLKEKHCVKVHALTVGEPLRSLSTPKLKIGNIIVLSVNTFDIFFGCIAGSAGLYIFAGKTH